MFDTEYEVPKPPSLPTYRQFVKTLSKGAVGKTAFNVEFIWVPGKFQNFTLQTHAFRLSIPEASPLFASLEQFTNDILVGSECKRFDVFVLPGDNHPFKFSLNPKKLGRWEKAGTSGYKFVEN
jgi:hypothetical protein